MIDEILTLLVLLTVFFSAFSHVVFSKNCESIVDREWTLTLKGICCIIVVMVHIPQSYSTGLQNLVGSFAYIAVTCFFLFSGYGLTISKNKKGYLKNFWRNRLVSLLIPMILVNMLNLIVSRMMGNEIPVLRTLLSIDGFVLMLISFYLAFYAIYGINIVKGHRTAALCVFTGGISVCAYLFEEFIPFTVWPVPCLGFIYGVLLAENKEKIRAHLEKGRTFDRELWSILGLTMIIGGGVSQRKESCIFWRLCVKRDTCINRYPVSD